MLSQGMAGTTRTQRHKGCRSNRGTDIEIRLLISLSVPNHLRWLRPSVSLWFLTYVRRNINEGLVEIDVCDRWIGDSLEWLYVRRSRGGARPATHIRQEGWRVFQECYNQHTERSQRR